MPVMNISTASSEFNVLCDQRSRKLWHLALGDTWTEASASEVPCEMNLTLLSDVFEDCINIFPLHGCTHHVYFHFTYFFLKYETVFLDF